MNYRNHYNAIIVRALTRPTPEGYTESHHIIPRCMGGTDDPTNLVRLTAREHFVAHQLLIKIHPEHPGLALAATFLRKRRDGTEVGNSHAYGWIKERMGRVVSEKQKVRYTNPDQRERLAEQGRRASSDPVVQAKKSGANHHFNVKPQTREAHAAAVRTPEYRAQFQGENNPMNRAGAREAQLAAVRTPEQRALRKETMTKLQHSEVFVAKRAAALKLRALVFRVTNPNGEVKQFVGNDAGCDFFKVSGPTWLAAVKRGERDGWKIERLGTVAELGLSV